MSLPRRIPHPARLASITALTAALLLAGQSASADTPADHPESAEQPEPTGSVVSDSLQRLDDGTPKTNGSGGYFVAQPYEDHSIARKVGPIYVGETFVSSGCTATVIDSPSGQLAITAEHCTNNIKAGKAVGFSPVANAESEPYGGWTIEKSFDSTELVDGQTPDVAVLVIAKKGSTTVADYTGGGLPIHPGISAGDSVRGAFLGYPGPEPYRGVTMSACIGDYTYHPGKGRSAMSRVSSQKECWVGGGSSGGPYIATDATGNPGIFTVLNSNGGSRIAEVAPKLINQAEDWISKR